MNEGERKHEGGQDSELKRVKQEGGAKRKGKMGLSDQKPIFKGREREDEREKGLSFSVKRVVKRRWGRKRRRTGSEQKKIQRSQRKEESTTKKNLLHIGSRPRNLTKLMKRSWKGSSERKHKGEVS